jgi:prepilin-type N-terminal cleavage/methylation domain-containing protein
MLKNTKTQKGFTIIEVLIVLAIAGLILLIVFLAVPALQRNSRNTQRKSDVSALLSGANEFNTNNGGALPGNATAGTNIVTLKSAAGASGGTDVKLGYYDPTKVTISTTKGANVTNSTDGETVVLVRGDKCNGANAVAGPSRGVVALYAVESGSNVTLICQEG